MLSKIATLHEYLRGYFFSEKRCLTCHIPFIPHNKNIYLCPRCATHIKLKTTPSCKLCGQYIPSATHLCIECANNTPPWDQFVFYGIYEDLLKAIILKYKFSADLSLLPLLSQYLYNACLDLPAYDIILPMPRHDKRLKDEGFNHIVELCRPLANMLQIPLMQEALQRSRYTPPQSTLPANKRKNNPSKSFIAKNVANKNILLIDDIITTGSTLRHASTTLKSAGAKNIYIAVIARVMR